MDDGKVYVVVMDTGGLFGMFLDPDLAERKAQTIAGVVAALPITADYRQAEEPS